MNTQNLPTAHPPASSHQLENNIANIVRSLGNPSLPIHILTNSVTSTLVANTVLALGHNPSLTSAEREIKDAVLSSHALLINIGTPLDSQVHALNTAALIASQNHIPWVLDPVMVDRFPSRLNLALTLINNKPTVIRGNHREIQSLAQNIVPKLSSSDTSIIAIELAQHLSTVVISTGINDFIAHNQECLLSSLGHPLQHTTTGMGCAMGALISCTLASAKHDPLLASLTATLMGGEAAIKAALHGRGPGTFPLIWIDELYNIVQSGFSELPTLLASQNAS
jgi:hydroxyethylthiazole kinase